jgi:hypothetical protein
MDSNTYPCEDDRAEDNKAEEEKQKADEQKKQHADKEEEQQNADEQKNTHADKEEQQNADEQKKQHADKEEEQQKADEQKKQHADKEAQQKADEQNTTSAEGEEQQKADEQKKKDADGEEQQKPKAAPSSTTVGYHEDQGRVWDGRQWSTAWAEQADAAATDPAIAVFPDGSTITVPEVLHADVLHKHVVKVGISRPAPKKKGKEKEKLWEGEHDTLGSLRVVTKADQNKIQFMALLAQGKQICQATAGQCGGDLKMGLNCLIAIGEGLVKGEIQADKSSIYEFRDEWLKQPAATSAQGDISVKQAKKSKTKDSEPKAKKTATKSKSKRSKPKAKKGTRKSKGKDTEPKGQKAKVTKKPKKAAKKSKNDSEPKAKKKSKHEDDSDASGNFPGPCDDDEGDSEALIVKSFQITYINLYNLYKPTYVYICTTTTRLRNP